MKHDFVQNSVLSHLAEIGWSTNAKVKVGLERGVDIKVRNDKVGRHFLVECKGGPGPNVKSPAASEQSSFYSAIGQIISRMHWTGKAGYKHGNKYGVAFPANFKGQVSRKLPYDVCNRLNLYVFFVAENGEVEMLDWHGIKELNESLKVP